MSLAPKQIYFLKPIGFVGPIKIGCSAWPKDRLLSLAKWSPFPIEILAHGLGDHTLERALHRRFAEDRSHKEWFHVSDALLAGVEGIRRGAPVAAAFGLVLMPTGRTWPKHRYVDWIDAQDASSDMARAS